MAPLSQSSLSSEERQVWKGRLKHEALKPRGAEWFRPSHTRQAALLEQSPGLPKGSAVTGFASACPVCSLVSRTTSDSLSNSPHSQVAYAVQKRASPALNAPCGGRGIAASTQAALAITPHCHLVSLLGTVPARCSDCWPEPSTFSPSAANLASRIPLL